MTWVRRGATAEQIQEDGSECRISADGKHPYKEVIVEHDRSAMTTSDGSQMVRDAEADCCMRQKGFVFKRPP
jgi:hypothetical protein